MFMDAPQTLIYVAGGAFLLGYLVAKIGAFFGNKFSSNRRDPRDDRIRSLEAELRVAQTDAEKARWELDDRNTAIGEEKERVEEKDAAIATLNAKVSQLRLDLKESVKKTRELRAELSERATENVKSEARIREVETELSVTQASADLIATGVLDYSEAPEAEDPAETDRRKVQQVNS